ncbi:MAG TPA: DUF1573 domain-containing protein [Flavobacterium sp.]|jgi:hypothetical protein
MKALKLTLITVIFGTVAAFAQPKHTEPAVKSVAASPVSWKSETIEIGEIPQGTPKAVDFEFKNTGKTTVIITNVKASCGCTATDYTKTPVKPGETAKVTATYNAANKGAFTKTVTVTTNAEETPKVLTFKGSVI